MVDFRAFRYRLPLDPAVIMGGREHRYREGILLRSADGIWADAAPLPGFSRESIDDVIAAIQSKADNPPPSLRFALESLERPCGSLEVPISSLLLGTSAEMLNQAREIAKLPTRAVKMKVARSNDVDADGELVRQICDILPSRQCIRLDANRGWDQNQAVHFALSIDIDRIDYIEEPTRDPCDLEAFHAETGCPYALDETLLERIDFDEFRNVSAFVVKPTLIGSYRKIDDLALRGVPLVFSSCFESGIGVACIARLAVHYSPSVPAGLDTYRWLERDVLRQPLGFRESSLVVPEQLDVDTCGLRLIG